MLLQTGKSVAGPRILFLTQRFPPAFGGGGQYLRLIRDHILKEGFESVVLTGNRGIAGSEEPGIFRLPSPNGQVFPRLDAYSFALMSAPALLGLRRRYDVIHTMGNAHYVYAAILSGRLLDKAVIVSSVQNRHDDPAAIIRERFGRLKNATFTRASAWICCSGLQVEEYRKAGYPMDKVRFIPNGTDPVRFHPCESPEEKGRLRDRLGLSRDAFTVVSIGAIYERKGIDLLVDAWIRFRRASGRGKLVLVGPDTPGDPGAEIDSGFVGSLREKLEAAGESGGVLFTGRVKNVEDYLRAADLFVLMSRGEGFPVAILEAMCCGLPFVLWDLPDYSGYDLRNGEQGFLIPPFDLDRLAACLADLSRSPERLESLGRRARASASRFTLESSLSQHAAFYRQVAELHRAERPSRVPAK